MIQKLTLIFFLFILFESVSQSNFKYEAGISFGSDLLLPKSIAGKYDFFTLSYNSGSIYSLGMSNKLNYKKLFLRFQGSVGYAIQSQNFVFTNDIDNIIDHNIKHRMPHWILDYSIGRDFQINELNKLHLEVGFSTVGSFRRKFDVSGSFSSTYVAPDNHYSSNSIGIAEYQYAFRYYWPTFLSPFIKCGISLPVAKNRLVFGLAMQWSRLAYKNLIVLEGDNYTAIAESKSRSSSFGLYLNYEFSK